MKLLKHTVPNVPHKKVCLSAQIMGRMKGSQICVLKYDMNIKQNYVVILSCTYTEKLVNCMNKKNIKKMNNLLCLLTMPACTQFSVPVDKI